MKIISVSSELVRQGRTSKVKLRVKKWGNVKDPNSKLTTITDNKVSLFASLSPTAETPIKEPVFIRILRLKCHCLNPLNYNPKEAEMGMVLI